MDEMEERDDEQDKQVKQAPGARAKALARSVPLCRVMIHNDQATPLEFVLRVLRQIFRKDQVDAAKIAIEAECKERALVGSMPLEHAEFRVNWAHQCARGEGYPLVLTIER